MDLLATLKHEADGIERDYVRAQCGSLVTLTRKVGWKCLRFGIPYQWTTREALSHISLGSTYDAVLLESEQCAPVLSNPATHNAIVILRVHNDEPAFLTQLGQADCNWVRRQFYLREARLFRKLSNGVFRRADHLLFVSAKECDEWIQRNPDSAHKAAWIPPSACARREFLRPRTGAGVLFVGGLSSASNQQGIAWYLENVHDDLLKVPGYEFLIVGRTRDASIPKRLRRLLAKPRIAVVKDAPDLEPFYERAAVFVNPMQSGASVKVKTVNALEYAVPTVTTTVGNEGTAFRNGEHLVVADTASEFVAAIKRLIANPHIGYGLAAAGLRFIEHSYDHKRLLSDVLRRCLMRKCSTPNEAKAHYQWRM